MGSTSHLVNPSSKLTLSATATSLDALTLSYTWHCPTNPAVLRASNLLSSTASQYLVLTAGSLDPWGGNSGRWVTESWPLSQGPIQRLQCSNGAVPKP